jgi:hypothetical protein
MAAEPDPQVLRLRKKHSPAGHDTPVAADGARLYQAQSFRQAMVAGLIVSVVFIVIWSMFTSAIGRIFPWMTIGLGIAVGLAVRRAGQGFDWRFPTLASLLTVLGAVSGKIVIAAGTTAQQFGISTVAALKSVTVYTWPVFFSESMTAVDWIFAAIAALGSAWFATRRLNRREYQAVRIWQEENAK